MSNQIKTSEHDEQVCVIDWCFVNSVKWPELDLIFAVPNGARLASGRDNRTAAIRMNLLKAEGLRPGASDLVLPSARGGYFGLFLEMKSGSGELSENQKQFLEGIERFGYFGAVAYGADEAIEILQHYLEQPRTEAKC